MIHKNIGYCMAILFSITSFSCAHTGPQAKADGKKEQNVIAQANNYARDGLYKEAAKAYEKVLKRQANNYTARRNLGLVQFRLGLYDDAVKSIESISNRFEEDFETQYTLAEAYRAQERYAEAIYRYQKALAIKQDDDRALKALAWSYYKIRYYSEAFNIAKKMRKKFPDDGQVAIILARVLLKLGKPEAGLKILAKSKQGATAEQLAFFQSVEGDLLVAQGACTKAVTTYKDALRTQPMLAGALLGLGRCQLEFGKTDDAISYMERALRIKTDLTEAFYLLAKAYEVKDKARSLAYYKKFYAKALKDPEFIDRAREAQQRISILRKGQENTDDLKDLQ